MSQLTNAEYLDHLNQNLAILYKYGTTGFTKFQATDVRVITNKYAEVKYGFKNYHLQVEIPYGGRILHWDIIFDPEDLGALPDFEFNDDYFLAEPDPCDVADLVPSWSKWDLTDHYSLTKIISEFLSLFKKTQLNKLVKNNKFAHIKEAFDELNENFNLSCQKVQVHVESIAANDINKEEYILINFLINLPVDLRKLPEYYQEDPENLVNPGEDFVHLHIQMKKLDNSQTKLSLTLSPRVEQVLGKLDLPKFSKDDNLSTYTAAIQNLIETQINIICLRHNARSLFVLNIVDTFSNDIIEYDASKFYKITFMYENEDLEDYTCMVTVLLGGRFPQERPKVQLNSLYCQEGKNCTVYLPFSSYKPLGSNAENVTALKMLLRQHVETFQHHKH